MSLNFLLMFMRKRPSRNILQVVFKRFLILSLVLTCFFTTIYSQAVCPISTAKVNSIQGRVVENIGSQKPWPDIVVEIRNFGDNETLVSTTKTDKDGLFSIAGLQKGKYVMNVIFDVRYISTYRLIAKVKRSNSSKKKPSILVRLGSDCWETEVTIVK